MKEAQQINPGRVPLRPWLALALLLAGLASLALVVAAAGQGRPFAFLGLLWIKPVRYLRFAILALGAAWLLWGGRGGATKRAAAQLVMLLFSLGLSIVIAEAGIRAVLARKMAAGSFEQFREMKKRGEAIKVKSDSPLALVITPSDIPSLVYELQPGLDLDFGHRKVRTNAQGMRKDAVYPVARQPHSVRILGLGDSGMFGWDVEQGRNYLDVLEQTLATRNDGVRYEALNTGTPGYNTRLEVELLKARGLAFRPDIVIVGWCENDFFLPHFFLKQAPLPKDRSLVYGLLFDRARTQELLAGPAIADREHTKGADGKVDLDQVPEGMKTGTFAAGVTDALRELQALAARHQFKLLVFGPLKPDILAIVNGLGIDACNTIEKIPEGKYPADWHVHAMHPREEGHRVLGELLAAELQARGWLVPRD